MKNMTLLLSLLFFSTLAHAKAYTIECEIPMDEITNGKTQQSLKEYFGLSKTHNKFVLTKDSLQIGRAKFTEDAEKGIDQNHVIITSTNSGITKQHSIQILDGNNELILLRFRYESDSIHNPPFRAEITYVHSDNWKNGKLPYPEVVGEDFVKPVINCERKLK